MTMAFVYQRQGNEEAWIPEKLLIFRDSTIAGNESIRMFLMCKGTPSHTL